MQPTPSDHFNGKTFFQAHHAHSGRRRDLLRWQLTARSTPWPRQVALQPQPPPPAPKGDDVVITWIGHASFLLQTTRINLLIDPVFSERASPFQWFGPRRAHDPGTPLSNLPRIDAVLISHDHYDHFDSATLRSIARKHDPLFLAPLRHSDLLSAIGAKRIVELDWWQLCHLTTTGGATCTFTPSKHWSNRFGSPRNHRLWGGFYLNLGPKRVWFVGDSGYDAEIFRSVQERCGPPDLALIPIGAYEPRWFMAPMHMNPAEALQAHRDVGARRSIGMHWGTFQLTDEGRDDPVHALDKAREAQDVSPEEFMVMTPGESLVL
jgi:L-ascorbate metabolism protein UlaG (beta-lactamase superfamily)